MLHALQGYVERVDADVRHSLARVPAALGEDVFAAGGQLSQAPELVEDFGHQRNIKTLARLGS